MNIYTNFAEIPSLKKPVITIGTFDGVHLGHQKVLSFLKSKAKYVKGESVVFTFHPHPRMVLHPNDHNLELIQTIDERVEKLSQIGIDHLIIFPFTKAFSKLSALEFIRDILVNKLGLHTLVIGYDHHFGKNREGSMQQLEELAPIYQFDICEINALAHSDINISSTKIRQALINTDFIKVNEFLGDYFRISGVVVKGDQIGKKIGYPTANINTGVDYKLMPTNGVYAVNININNQTYFGMLNIGFRPTISNSNEKRIEVHIFDFNADIYNQKISVGLIDYIRPEIKFSDTEALIEQLKEDEKNCRSIVHSDIL